MYDPILMKILQAEDDRANKEFDDMLLELLMNSDLKAKVTSWHVVHDQVKIESVLKGIDHIDNEGMFELGEQLALVQD